MFDENELKNRISLSLKDPILQQYFEILCKRLAEYELLINMYKKEKEIGGLVLNEIDEKQ